MHFRFLTGLIFICICCANCLHICSPLGLRQPRQFFRHSAYTARRRRRYCTFHWHRFASLCYQRERERERPEGGCLLLSSSAFFSFGPKSSSSSFADADAVAERVTFLDSSSLGDLRKRRCNGSGQNCHRTVG